MHLSKSLIYALHLKGIISILMHNPVLINFYEKTNLGLKCLPPPLFLQLAFPKMKQSRNCKRLFQKDWNEPAKQEPRDAVREG